MKRKASQQRSGPRPKLQRQGGVYGKAALKRKPSALLTQELKFNDFSNAGDISTTGVIVDMTTFAAGDTALLRDGNKILAKSIQLRGTFATESLAQNAIVRYMIIHDKNSNGTAPTFAQVFSTTPIVTHVYSLKSIANASRFTTLLDRTIVINNQSDTAGAFAKAYIDEYIKVPESCQLVAFADGTSAVPISGSLSLMIISDVATGITDVDSALLGRLRFVG